MVFADVRPAPVDLSFRPGNPVVVVATWSPAGTLAGRTFVSRLGSLSLNVAVVGDVMTITASEEQTATVGTSAGWVLTETTAGQSVDLLVGTWVPSMLSGDGATSVPIQVAASGVAVAVTVAGGGAVTSVNGETGAVALSAADVGADPAGSAAAVAGSVTAVEADVGALDGRVTAAETDIDSVQGTATATATALAAHQASTTAHGDPLGAVATHAGDLARHGGRLVAWQQASDWSAWTATPVNTIDNTLSLTASNGVGVAAGVGGPTGDDRRLYLLSGVTGLTDVEVYADFEVTAGSVGAGQAGLAMRAGSAQAVIAWNNIFFSATGSYLLGVWEYSGTVLHHTNQSATSLDGFRRRILSASGNGTTVTVRTRTPHGLAVGTIIDESATTGSFQQRPIASVPDAFTFTFAATQSGSWTTGEYRTVVFTGRRRVAARVVGNRVTWKQWFPDEPEPLWSDPLRAATALLPATLTHSGGPPPASGGVGIVLAHMGTGAVVRVSDFTVRRLA